MRKRVLVATAFLVVGVLVVAGVTAGCGGGGGDSEMLIEWIWPTSGKAGSEFAISGENFGETQGKKSYVSMSGEKPEIVNWSNEQIIVKVPEDMETGVKGVKVFVNGEKSNEYEYEVIIRR